MIVSEESAQAAFDYVQKHAPEYARLYGLYQMRKETKELNLAIAYDKAKGATVMERTMNARRDEDFIAACDRIQADIAKYMEYHTRIQLAHAKVSVWQSENANARRGV